MSSVSSISSISATQKTQTKGPRTISYKEQPVELKYPKTPEAGIIKREAEEEDKAAEKSNTSTYLEALQLEPALAGDSEELNHRVPIGDLKAITMIIIWIVQGEETRMPYIS